MLDGLEKSLSRGLPEEAIQAIYKAVIERYRRLTNGAGSCHPLQIDACLEQNVLSRGIMANIRAARQLRPQPLRSGPTATPPQVIGHIPMQTVPQARPPQQTQGNVPVPQPLSTTTPTMTGVRIVTDAGQPISPALGSIEDRLARAVHEKENALRNNQALTHRLTTCEQRSAALSGWAANAQTKMITYQSAIDRLNQELKAEHAVISNIKQELERYKATNAELRNQVGDLMTRNSAVNASAVRFRQDLWHSEMRWRDASTKLNKLNGVAKQLNAVSESLKSENETLRTALRAATKPSNRNDNIPSTPASDVAPVPPSPRKKRTFSPDVIDLDPDGDVPIVVAHVPPGESVPQSSASAHRSRSNVHAQKRPRSNNYHAVSSDDDDTLTLVSKCPPTSSYMSLRFMWVQPTWYSKVPSLQPAEDPSTSLSSGKSAIGVGDALALPQEPSFTGRSISPSSPTFEMANSNPITPHQYDTMKIDMNALTASTTSADIVTTTPAGRQSPSFEEPQKQLNPSASSVVNAVSTQQTPVPIGEASEQLSTTVGTLAADAVSSDNGELPPMASSHAVKSEVILAGDVELTAAMKSIPEVPSEPPLVETDTTIPIRETQDADWKSLPFAFFDMLTNAFEVLESVALNEPRLICKICYDAKPILKDDVDRYTNRIGILLEHLELMHGEVYEEAKEQAEEESQPV